MTMTYEQTVEAFPVLEAAAIAGRTCFCKCGCRNADVAPVLVWGSTKPGTCSKCRKSRAPHLHERANDAAHVYVDPEDATLNPRKRNFIQRLVSPDKRGEAEAYAREYGTDGSVLMSALCERVRAGKQLTDAQVEAALRSRDSERRSAKATYRRSLAEQKRKSKDIDLLRVVIPPDIDPGYYAVQGDDGAWVILLIEKPLKGTLRGFIVVKASVDGALTKYGVQYPQPAHETTGMRAQNYVQSYRGHMPHLVYELVMDPDAAAIAYTDLMGRAA
jgi:hypothetical protein